MDRALEDADRPDRLGAVLDLLQPGAVPTLRIREAQPGVYARSARLQEIAAHYRASMPVRISDTGDVLDPERQDGGQRTAKTGPLQPLVGWANKHYPEEMKGLKGIPGFRKAYRLRLTSAPELLPHRSVMGDLFSFRLSDIGFFTFQGPDDGPQSV